ncbi:MAG: YicC/YloC family endoribonuclease [Pseudomonadota bacterium]
MTAFARREAELAAGSVSWELRSVNHRYLEIGLRLPEELRALEAGVRERINARLGRGKVDCICRYKPVVSGDIAFDIDTGNLERLLDACRAVTGRLPAAAPLHPLELLRWPGVVREQAVDTTPLINGALALLEETLEELVSARAREGEQIRGLLLARCSAMADQVEHVRTLLPEIRAGLRRRLEQRLAELEVPVDPGRLEQELVLQLQKIDVDEELDRLGSHLGEVRRVLDSDEPVGRRLDFLMQELNREANTLGSKSVVVATTNVSVELKVLIEQMREQIQNIE